MMWVRDRGAFRRTIALAKTTSSWRDKRVIFLGPSGSGKTSCAVALYRKIVEGWPFAFMVNAYQLAEASYAARSGTTVTASSRAEEAPVLLLDDLGAEDE